MDNARKEQPRGRSINSGKTQKQSVRRTRSEPRRHIGNSRKFGCSFCQPRAYSSAFRKDIVNDTIKEYMLFANNDHNLDIE